MITFIFKYNGEIIATIENLSKLSNKKVWKMFEEAITQHAKGSLLTNLSPIREKLETETVIFEYDFNSNTEEYNISYKANSEVGDLIEQHLKRY